MDHFIKAINYSVLGQTWTLTSVLCIFVAGRLLPLKNRPTPLKDGKFITLSPLSTE